MLTYKELWEIQEPLLAMAAILQSYLQFSGSLKQWKIATADWWINLQLITWPERHQINQKFLEVFDQVYGGKTFSWRRLYRSTLFSIFFVFCFYWLFVRIGMAFFKLPEEFLAAGNSTLLSLFQINIVTEAQALPWFDPITLLVVFYDALGLNVIPDFVSLLETAWILRIACKKEAPLILLLLLDFLLTTLIWMAALGVATLNTAILTYGIDFFTSHDFPIYDYLNKVFNFSLPTAVSPVPFYWAMVSTTYTTSLLWILFIVTILSIAFLKRTTSILVTLLESKWVINFPIVLVVGIPCLIAWPVLFTLRQVI